MKFKYSLQSVLNFKKELEDFSRLRLKEASAALEKRKEEMQTQVRQRNRWFTKWQEKNLQGIDGREYFLYQIFNEHWRDKIKIIEREQKAAAQKMELEKEKLKTIRQEREVLERLKAKKWRRFWQEINKKEQKVNDEIVLFKYNPLLKE
ncbi:MAG: flagellar export protein FliJ [Thermodesulfobacteriota bacterium]